MFLNGYCKNREKAAYICNKIILKSPTKVAPNESFLLRPFRPFVAKPLCVLGWVADIKIQKRIARAFHFVFRHRISCLSVGITFQRSFNRQDDTNSRIYRYIVDAVSDVYGAVAADNRFFVLNPSTKVVSAFICKTI